MSEIRVSAVVMRDALGRVLTVRKRGTSALMLPGGKPSRGESPAQTAMREFEEELGVALNPSTLTFLGEFRAAAANEIGFEVIAHVFEHPFVGGIAVHSEIEWLEWLDPRDPALSSRTDMAPLNTEHVFPLLRGEDRTV